VAAPSRAPAAPAAAQGEAAGPVSTEDAVAQVLARAKQFTAPGMRGVEVQLQPESLGRVALRLTEDVAGQLRAWIRVERPEVAQAMRARLDDLANGLASHGLKIGQITVGETPQSDQAANSGHERGSWRQTGAGDGGYSGGLMNGRDGGPAHHGRATAMYSAARVGGGAEVTAGRTFETPEGMPITARGRRLYLVA
jgi:hypothetical protein